MPQRWMRFKHGGEARFGTLDGDVVHEHAGDMFAGSDPTGARFRLHDVELLTPTTPSKVIALWNNFHALADKLKLAAPAEPLYLLKAPNSYLAAHQTIRKPLCDAKVAFEGELGIVIGRTCTAVAQERALDHVFGYTCANDVTVPDILHRDPSFTQWDRAKGFDTFCPMGPVVATGLDPATLSVTTLLDGDVRQNYPISDMRFSVQQLVSMISRDMTLHPGDVILCGTSVGVGSMKPGSLVEVQIDGIGKLSNRFA
ncbi:fumarylacetoacetate hydrolase family protein [Piscinibacter sp. XHJ-5]|uniref:fumarylacetoacetate hydrolase family protein n=1 Tax=Piscinibacter sp. XHJ-5 TaxID=3037797 RepID=UPI002453631A|nr:fumarylacetoacetate hydrolase family protein [Piscinibacter sp. XHJ-5]